MSEASSHDCVSLEDHIPLSPQAARPNELPSTVARVKEIVVNDEDSDLGTPGSPKDPFSDDLDDDLHSQATFAHHAFYGPTASNDSAQTVHDTRRVELGKAKNSAAYFKSEPKESNHRASMAYQQSIFDFPSPTNKSMSSGTRGSIINMAKSTMPKISKSLPTLPSFLKRSGAAAKDSDAPFCDGCGQQPIKGVVWSCSVCVNFHLCPTCYAQGVHGMEDTPAMQMYEELNAFYKLQKRCKLLTTEFLGVLYTDVCKKHVPKFEYLGNWLASILDKKMNATKIPARGVEIPHLTPSVRTKFVDVLMPLVSNRRDLQVYVEWLPETEGDLETVRIWMSDLKTRTKSPFAVAAPPATATPSTTTTA
ncbi:hypothetical protein DYB30_001074 [Aphanomyces astaci]|uniref:ZZ-type domain-containing protein n=1 Tax=Aphanomyces astaci TaxID=112090 RepID=A0A397DKZ6_APHAT|nr:hypothetical protein DYB30_001074 [Aphanomyces astaci]RHZ11148.1 hypothetical protein DYB26_000012 [Aphanomyces astaci]